MTDLLAALGDILTPRQRAVLALMAEGLPSHKIAVRLGVGRQTARRHIVAIWDRLCRAGLLTDLTISRSQGTIS